MTEIEAELDAVVRRERDLAAENRKLQRHLMEQQKQSEEERRQVLMAAEQNQALQQRVQNLRRQLEEAVSSLP